MSTRLFERKEESRGWRDARPLVAKGIFWSILLFLVLTYLPAARADEADEKTQSLQSQIEELERDAKEIDDRLREIRQETESLSREVAIFNNEIKKRELELRRMGLAIRQAGVDIAAKSSKIEEIIQDVEKNRQLLAKNLRLLHAYDEQNLVIILAKNRSISDFFRTVDAIRTLQASTDELVQTLRFSRKQLEIEKTELEEFREDQQSLRALQEIEKRGIEVKRAEKDNLLKITKGNESAFQNLLNEKKRDIAALKTQLFYLERTGVTAEDAVRVAELAAQRTGIRTAFLLALLEVETGRQFAEGVISVGTNVGTGNWRDDMYLCYQRLGQYFARYYGSSRYVTTYNARAEREKNAFFDITGRLGLDPDKMPVSKEPRYIGCGGAMGQAQFIPTTWLLFESRVAELTGHNPPNPWDIEDAFTASAVFLADSGASSKTERGEIRAAKTYISGKPTCSNSTCNWYANTILSLARDIERIL